MTAPHYKAFISYSHRDEAWARWLQHSLEKYRVPKRLVGQPGAFGPIPARLHPVFRDREDLSSASDLSSQIKQELSLSETLIVICSPAAAQSQWVNEEVRYFRQLEQGDRILALIVDGDPQSVNPQDGCFPTSMVRMPDGSAKEPLAADVRKYADGKHLAFLKIVSGMLGIRLDELRRRDAQRRTRNRFGYALAVLALTTIIGWLVFAEATTRATAQAQRTNTEELLGFMLGDLKRLAPIEGLEIISADDEMQPEFREQLGFQALDNEELMEKALLWREQGLENNRLGELDSALNDFERSRAAIIELHQREGNSARALFELGQAEFYMGMVYMGLGELDRTEESWVRYGAVTRRLVNSEPNNAVYVMELSYTLMNLGALEQSRPRPDASRSLELIQASLQYNQMALVLDPENDVYRRDRATSVAWLADAWLEQCELDNALESRELSVQLRRELAFEQPDDNYQRVELAYMLTGLASVQQQIGLNEAATESFTEAIALLRQLHQAEPDNHELEWQFLYRQQRLARHMMAIGQPDPAWGFAHHAAARVDWLSDPQRNSDHLLAVEASLFRLDYARMLLARGETQQGKALLRQVTQDLAGMVRNKPGFRDSLAALSLAYFEYWKHFNRAADDEIGSLLNTYLADPQQVTSCSDANQAARLALVNGDLELARRYTGYVLDKGYLEAGFVNFCKAYQLCDLP